MRAQLQRMLEAGQDSALLRFSLAQLDFKDQDYRAAAAHLEAALAQDENYTAAYKLLGRSLLALQEHARAAEVLARGLTVARERGDKQAEREMQVFARRAQRNSGPAPQ